MALITPLATVIIAESVRARRPILERVVVVVVVVVGISPWRGVEGGYVAQREPGQRSGGWESRMGVGVTYNVGIGA